MAKLCIVHISDLHIHAAEDPVLGRIKGLTSCASAPHASCESVVVLVSGDIAYSGKKEEYQLALKAFVQLAQELGDETGKTVTWVLVPGNHDGTFKESNQIRLLAIDGVKSDESKIDDSVIATAVAPQVEYFNFEESLRGDVCRPIFKDSLLSIQEQKVGDKVVAFWEFNASWMSKVPEKQGELVFPVDPYHEHLRRSADFRIAVLHHPLNWYTQQTYHPLRQFLTKNFSMVFSGHEHIQNGHMQRAFGVERECLFIEGGTLGPHDSSEASEYSTVLFDVNSGDLEESRYIYQEQTRRFVEDKSRKKSERVKLISARDFEISSAAIEQLEEMAAPFSHPVQDVLRLSDVYVEPVFSPNVVDEDNSSPNCGVSQVLEELESQDRILVRADEHHGKTSLVNQLMLRLVQRGNVPIKLSAKDLSGTVESKKERIVEEAVAFFYGDAAVPVYQSTERSKKVAVIDDLDKLGSNPEKYEHTLSFVKRHFGKCIVTVNDRFDVSMLGSTDASHLFSEFSEYRMRGFSYSMRTELIQRWYSLDLSLDKEQLEKKVHEAQNQIDHAVAKALIPSTAFNTLMILQGLEATQKSNPIDVGVAQHYDAMLRRRLTDSGINLKALDGTYAYLAHLAWWMRQKGVTVLDRSELAIFNENFCAQVHSTDVAALVDTLIKARILNNVDAVIQFRHPSARYFFLAHYIAENQEDDADVKKAAIDACKRLYRKDNSNLIVFLASRSSSRWIIKEVADVLKQLLPKLLPFNATKDSSVLNSWVTQTAKLAVGDKYDPEKRKQIRERDEEAQQLEDRSNEGEAADDISQLDLFSQINLVFKTSEILGLILKSKFGSLGAQLKKDLLHELFTGPLRAISFFLSVVNDHPKVLIEYLSSNWSDKLPNMRQEQREKLAQKFVYFSLGAYSQALMQRQGEISGSPDLAQYITSFVEDARASEKVGLLPDGTSLTYRLIGVACRLSYPADVPTAEIERLGKELKSNPFAYTILQGLVGNHLYMFPVPYSLRQKLAAAVDLDLKVQLANEVTNRDAKTVQSRNFSHRNPKSLLMRLSARFLIVHEEVGRRAREEQEKKKAEQDRRKNKKGNKQDE